MSDSRLFSAIIVLQTGVDGETFKTAMKSAIAGALNHAGIAAKVSMYDESDIAERAGARLAR